MEESKKPSDGIVTDTVILLDFIYLEYRSQMRIQMSRCRFRFQKKELKGKPDRASLQKRLENGTRKARSNHQSTQRPTR